MAISGLPLLRNASRNTRAEVSAMTRALPTTTAAIPQC
jgi:hypothetical protein